jgi:hypothetical protein
MARTYDVGFTGMSWLALGSWVSPSQWLVRAPLGFTSSMTRTFTTDFTFEMARTLYLGSTQRMARTGSLDSIHALARTGYMGFH